MGWHGLGPHNPGAGELENGTGRPTGSLPSGDQTLCRAWGGSRTQQQSARLKAGGCPGWRAPPCGPPLGPREFGGPDTKAACPSNPVLSNLQLSHFTDGDRGPGEGKRWPEVPGRRQTEALAVPGATSAGGMGQREARALEGGLAGNGLASQVPAGQRGRRSLSRWDWTWAPAHCASASLASGLTWPPGERQRRKEQRKPKPPLALHSQRPAGRLSHSPKLNISASFSFQKVKLRSM